MPEALSPASQAPAYEPTEAEIREACLLIQSEWSDAERERRQVGGRVVVWQVPTATITGIRASVADK